MKMSRLIGIIGLFLLGGLAVLSVYGAFLGAENAGRFFRSPPLAMMWIILVLILAGGIVFFRRLRTRPFLFLTHAGCLLVLLGGLWGSEKGIHFRNHFFGSKGFTKGLIPLYEGQSSPILHDYEGHVQGQLPFEIHLHAFEVQYYDGPQFIIHDKADPRHLYTIPVEAGRTFFLGPSEQAVEFGIVRSFKNLQIRIVEGGVAAVEGPEDLPNPGHEVQFVLPDGGREIQYVFERHELHSLPKYRFEVRYCPPQMPKEYASQLSIIENGQEQVRKRIRVNDPLFYKGYLFHQNSWGQDHRGLYSVIGVVSNSGLAAVFAGYGMLAIGLFGGLWILPAADWFRKKGETT